MLLLWKLAIKESGAYKKILCEDSQGTKTDALQILVEFSCSLHSWVCEEFQGPVIWEVEVLHVNTSMFERDVLHPFCTSEWFLNFPDGRTHVSTKCCNLKLKMICRTLLMQTDFLVPQLFMKFDAALKVVLLDPACLSKEGQIWNEELFSLWVRARVDLVHHCAGKSSILDQCC
jgi:hypothetical protein